MEFVRATTLGILLLVSLMGCSKKGGVEGTVVDCQGNPLAGMKIIAKQLHPVKGYELFETTTEADGYFTFDKLLPTSSYELAASADGSTTNTLVTTESGAAGVTSTIPQPLTIRFRFSKDGATVLDSKSGLMWARNASVGGGQIRWDEAMIGVEGLEIGGYKGWRLPTKEELTEFLKSGGANPAEYFNSMGFVNVPNPKSSYWTSSSYTERSDYAWIVALWDGSVSYDFKGCNYNLWPVRAATK